MKIRTFLPVLLAAACSSTPRAHPDAVRALVEEGQTREVPELDLAVEVVATELPPQVKEYRLGAADVLDVQVEGHPQFSVRSRNLQHKLLGFRIQEDGRVYLPLLGGVPARGKTILELQADVAERMKRFLAEPNVAVDVLSYDSQKFYVLGAVEQPGVFAVDGRTTLLEGLGLAGGIREGGDVEGAFVVRGRTLLPVSLGDLLLRGDTSRNVPMMHGDLVYVPTSEKWQVYVLGEVTKPGIVPIPRGGLDLAAAIAAAGGLDLLYSDPNEIRVFRGSWQAPRSFTLSAEDIYRYGVHIRLKPGDRIHVAPRGLATWNRTLTLLLPFLDNAIAGATLGVAINN